MAITLFPDGRILHNGVEVASEKMVDFWAINTDISNSDSDSDIPGSKFTRNDKNAGASQIGAGMSVDSNGIWTFPTTGIYKVEAHWSLQNSSSSSTWCDMDILFAQDGTNYNAMSRAVASVSASGYYSQPTTTIVVDVTDASVCKLKFKVNYAHASTSVRGDGSGSDYSWFDFIRLADT